MKKRELVVGVRYAVLESKRRTSRGLPDCREATYMGESMPDIKIKSGHVLFMRRYHSGETGSICQYKPSDVYATYEQFTAEQEAAHEAAERREEANKKAAAYLVHHLTDLYNYTDVWFNAEDGVFHVSPKTMAELHGLPVPGKIELPPKQPVVKDVA